ncbi:hypothetical protein GCM10007897_21700 [Sphingobium jiangsuense]|uniref:DoxX family membrane protein n=1 Tax=Sphingobium jiangsuense TaxID=870476 RepID=A0A7W6BI67_9SPHN|nr:DoxX family membrane protein [Sphingobium jiangsuense]MBB3927378.1 hypothetical protein [Sphingobium jiangsuense]GLT00780.1 hypothetical protein GCM10007897_21700 [Sphingobium jiangsuense]
MTEKMAVAARLLMGIIYTLNGLNWWFKIITPYPSISDFAHMAPPPDVVGAMIENGIMFHMVKGIELLTGIALLLNLLTPLMLVAVLPITISVFIVDVFFVAHLRGMVMGAGSLALNLYLLLVHLESYRPMLVLRAADGAPLPPDAPNLADRLQSIVRPVRPVIGVAAILLGAVMLGWMLVMIGQYIAHPLPFGAGLPPRP